MCLVKVIQDQSLELLVVSLAITYPLMGIGWMARKNLKLP